MIDADADRLGVAFDFELINERLIKRPLIDWLIEFDWVSERSTKRKTRTLWTQFIVHDTIVVVSNAVRA